jgi:prepilin-type N-terminal cleavage/methylation domain-containing protein
MAIAWEENAMAPKRSEHARERSAGFSLVELLVVAAIIVIMAAVATPAIARYVRTYRIRTAAQEVASVMAEARGKAIARNTNRGVLFIVLAPGSPGNPLDVVAYRYVMEDDVDGGIGGWPDTDSLLNDARQLGPPHFLPNGIDFVDATAGANNERALRFNRLGLMCDPGSAGCRPLDPGTNYLYFDGAKGAAYATLLEARTGLQSQVSVVLGGRARILNSWTVD